MESIKLTTEDGVDLSALYWQGNTQKAVVLLHMMPAVKESWVSLAEKIVPTGATIIAPDFRGHGESGGGDYRTFSAEQHQQYYYDVQAVVDYLLTKNPHLSISMVGASIGANMVIKYMSKNHQVEQGVALSAGVNYHGVMGADDAAEIKPFQNLLVVAAKDDGGAAESTEEIAQVSGAHTELEIVDTGGHGTDMFLEHPELMDKVVEFLNLNQ